MINLDTAETPKVRLAVREDEDALMEVARQMHPVAALCSADGKALPLDEDLVRSELYRALLPPNPHRNELPAWIGVVGSIGDLLGSVYLAMGTEWYSREPILVERWLYVRPDSRRSSIAVDLIDFAKKSAAAAGLPLHVGHMTQGREKAKGRFYRRHFGTPIGASYLHTPTR